MEPTPEEKLNQLQLVYLNQTSVKSQLIYTSTLLAILTLFLALPFIKVTLSVKGIGLIQNGQEQVDLLAPSSGYIIRLNLSEDQQVAKGAILLTIDTSLLQQQLSLTIEKKDRLNLLLQDVKAILSSTTHPKLRTGLYRANLQQYQTEMANSNQLILQRLRDYNRYFQLYQKKVITLAEFENHQFNYEKAKTDQQLIIKNYSTRWQIEANQYLSEIQNNREEQIKVNAQKRYHNLSATVTGIVQNLIGLQVGDLVYSNQKLGEISPRSNLIAYCYIQSKDIGWIKNGQLVQLQIDSFNFSEWGSLSAEVSEISSAPVTIKEVSFFRVKCQLKQKYLQLKNGQIGRLKKGMQFHAYFKIANRSLFNLLGDKAKDWLIPENS